MLPFAKQWDEEKIFPKEALRKLAELGFAGNVNCSQTYIFSHLTNNKEYIFSLSTDLVLQDWTLQ